jgi:hypothetical protein
MHPNKALKKQNIIPLLLALGAERDGRGHCTSA